MQDTNTGRMLRLVARICIPILAALAVPMVTTSVATADAAATNAANVYGRYCYANVLGLGWTQGWAHLVRTSSGITKSHCEFSYPDVTLTAAYVDDGFACNNEAGLTYETHLELSPTGRGFITCWKKSS